MSGMKGGCFLTASLALVLSFAHVAAAAPPAPTLVSPASGASLVQPITLDWNAVSNPNGPIGSYTWQVGTTSAFTKIIASGFTDMDPDASVPTPTADKVSGLPNGTYFWRVKATQLVGGAQGSVDSAWSAVRSFTVTGLGAAPAAPAFSTPATGASFHVREFFNIKWSAVAGAHYYLLEVDDEPTFSYPLTLTSNALTFGTQAQAGWGNALNVYYRVRAVSADNGRSLPSATLTIHVTNTAPVPPAPTLVSPAAGATAKLPFFFDWSDTANPQVPGYDLDVDTDPNFAGDFGVLFLGGVTRSDFMVTPDLLPPGKYFWRIRALHGDAFGPWTAGRAVTVAAQAATPPDLNLFAIITEPGNGYGGNSTQARVMLDKPAPAAARSLHSRAIYPRPKCRHAPSQFRLEKPTRRSFRLPPVQFRRMESSASSVPLMARAGNKVRSASFPSFMESS